MRVGGILLTGGASRRLGFDKARAVHEGTPLAVRVARVLADVCAESIEVGPGVSGLRHVREDPPGAGPLAALIAGADALAALGPLDAVLLVGADLVHIDVHALTWLAQHPGSESIVPRHAGRPQYVCARYGAATLEEARSRLAVGERSFRWLAGLDPAVVRFVDEAAWPDGVGADTFADVDTPDDARRFGVVAPDAP